jgi:hypothetical protein
MPCPNLVNVGLPEKAEKISMLWSEKEIKKKNMLKRPKGKNK